MAFAGNDFKNVRHGVDVPIFSWEPLGFVISVSTPTLDVGARYIALFLQTRLTPHLEKIPWSIGHEEPHTRRGKAFVKY